MRQMTLRVAIAQIDSVLGDVPANVRTHLAMIAEARAAGVDLLLFPELSLTGYDLGDMVPDVAVPRDDPVIGGLAEAAQGITVVFGFVEEGPAAQFHNAAIAVRDGRIVFLHHKLNLPSYGSLEEHKLFAPGSYVETFPISAPWTGGVLVCADLWNPALVHLVMVHGATVLLAPINSALDVVGGAFENPDGWSKAIDFYSLAYGVPILMANRVGTENGSRFWGQSRIVGPNGQTMARAGEHESVLIFATLDYDDLRRARFHLPTVRDSNLHLLNREVGRLARKVGVPTFLRDD